MALTKKISEQDVIRDIITWLNYQTGTYAFRNNTTGVFDPVAGRFRKASPLVAVGGSDILFIYRDAMGIGRFGCFEVKTGRAFKRFYSRPGPHELRQQAFIEKIRACGGFAEVVCELAQAMHHFQELKRMPDPVSAVRL